MKVPSIAPACLPSSLVNTNGLRCWVRVCIIFNNFKIGVLRCFQISGWGRTDFNPNTPFVAIQKEIDVPLVEQNLCQNQLRATRLTQNFQLDFSSFVCAGGELGKDSVRKHFIIDFSFIMLFLFSIVYRWWRFSVSLWDR